MPRECKWKRIGYLVVWTRDGVSMEQSTDRVECPVGVVWLGGGRFSRGKWGAVVSAKSKFKEHKEDSIEDRLERGTSSIPRIGRGTTSSVCAVGLDQLQLYPLGRCGFGAAPLMSFD